VSDTLRKVIVWRVISFTVAMTYNLAFVGGWQRSFLLTVLLMSVLTGMHYMFELWWEKDRE
jgi:uncharacterized membrane protein